MRARVLVLAACVISLAPPARAADDGGAARDDPAWGVTIWGVSYHVDDAIDYDEHNWGAGLRYYLNHHVFFEGDVLRNSNRGVVLPVSAGVELGLGTIFHACRVSAVGALTLAYYQNLRTDSDYFRFGPVPGVAVRCGRVQPNVIAVLSPSHRVLAAIVGSVTIMLPGGSR
jgi:hypothetical protein